MNKRFIINKITNLAVSIIPEDGKGRKIVKKLYRRFLASAPAVNEMYNALTTDDSDTLEHSVKISFVGDLILLREMVEHGYNSNERGYNYDSMFDKVRPYWEKHDCVFAVFEGPTAGEAARYTSADYGDGTPLYCNYPDEFAYAVKRAGVNFVTLANNHLYDRGKDGAGRTIEVLDKVGIKHIGYQDATPGKVLNIKGLRIVVLAYTYGFNYYRSKYFFEHCNEGLPHLIVPKKDKFYNHCIDIVRKDFEWAKSQNPNTIIVMPHWGEQFLHTPDKNQLHWAAIFKSLGADIIFGCHPHATQPVRFEENTLVCYCPGNFVNSYISNDGDASMMIEAYLDKNSGKPIAVSIVPMFTYGKYGSIYNALPVHLAVENRQNLSLHDWRRLQQVHNIVLKSAYGLNLTIDHTQNRYILTKEKGYLRQVVPSVSFNRSAILPLLIEKSSSVTFIGDSITEGTLNGGYGWFEPLMNNWSNKRVVNISKGGITSRILFEYKEKICSAKTDLYVIAVGCNDIRYRNAKCCAMTSAEYVANLSIICDWIKESNPYSQIVFIAP